MQPLPKTSEHARVAAELARARSTRLPVSRISTRYPSFTVDDAYNIQSILLHDHLSDGRRMVGRKVGLTSAAMRAQLGVDSPDFGYLLDDMVHVGGSEVSTEQFIAPLVEPELGFILKRDLAGPGITLEEAVDAIESVHAAIEIIDSRVAEWDIGLVDTVADNASSGAVVWNPEPLDTDPRRLDEVICTMSVGEATFGPSRGTGVMGHPVAPLAWLANALGERGIALLRGELILTGSFMAAVAVKAGASVCVNFEGLGMVTTTFGSEK